MATSSFGVLSYWTFVQGNHGVTESQICRGWKRPREIIGSKIAKTQKYMQCNIHNVISVNSGFDMNNKKHRMIHFKSKC